MASAFGSSPRKRAEFRAVAVTMDSIMKPVLGTPTGTGLGPTGGMAMQTPTPKDFERRLIPLLAVHRLKTARIGEPFDVADRRPRGTRASWKRRT